MKKRHLNIIISLFSLYTLNAFSQSDCTTSPPLPPVLTSVSVQPETGKTEFRWTLSPSANIAAYIIYSYKNGDGQPLDTLWSPTETSYILTSTATKYESFSYVIAAMRLPRCTSIFSNVLNTIFTKADVDTCFKKITVSWNSYASFPVRVSGYSILVSVNGGNYTEAAIVGSDKTSFTLADFINNTDYCFIIKANLEGGTFSTSNKACINAKIRQPPGWINADYATVNQDKNIDLSFTIDPVSEINRFRLDRKSGPTADFTEIAQPPAVNGKILFSDKKADINTINFYRLSAVNSCNNAVTVSNLSSNIVLSLEVSGNDLKLSWNTYKKWMGIVSSYSLFINTGSGFRENALIQPSDSVYRLGYETIMREVSGNEICFYLTAQEKNNPNGINGQSFSSPVCTTPTELITVPNVFTPNNDLDNDLFKPVLSFIPSGYNLVITDRQGKILFESGDYNEVWDGTLKGNPQPQGVFLWYLKVKTPSGKTVTRAGTITIIRNR